MKAFLKRIFFCIIAGLPTILFSSSVTKAIVKEKPLVVVVCSYNNSKWTENTLNSIFSQDYTNFRLIIVDDCSTDGNQQVIQKYIDDNHLADRVTFIQNKKRQRKLFNLYRVLYLCDDDEIVVMVDGDDFLANNQVLSQLSAMYDSDDIWFTYGQYKNVPASEATLWGHKEMGYCRQVPKHIQSKRAYRYYSFIYMHPSSFRAWLFKLVKLEDLITDKIKGFEGDFYPASNDVAMYFPMVEMAHTRIRFIADILYIRNLYSEIVGFKVDRRLQTTSAREIRKKDTYSTLFKPKKNRLASARNCLADMFIVCKYATTSLHAILENVHASITGLGTIHVFFMGTLENKAAVRKIKQEFPAVLFIPCDAEGNKTLQNRLLDFVSCSKNEHIIMGTDFFEIVTPIHISDFIYWLEKTFAYKFYLNRDASKVIIPRYVQLDDDICAWKIARGVDTWQGMGDTEDVFLCHKKTLLNALKKINFDTVYSFIKEMHKVDVSGPKVGLFCCEQKMKSMV